MRRAIVAPMALLLLTSLTRTVRAQVAAGGGDSTTSLAPHYWRTVAIGAGTSILLHEAGHIGVALATGHNPSFGFDKLRPTIYSGINSHSNAHEQFLFSAAGLTVQSLLDEAILDIPHARGSAFERGLLGGGIGTTLFYLTLGRTGSVSDVDFMARTHAMNKTQITLLFGGIAAMHTWRISRDPHYARFFTRATGGGAQVGMEFGRWAGGPVGRWTGGPVDRWAGGPVDRWTGGPVDRWAGRSVNR